MSMANAFRLYGPEVGKATAIVDAEVDGVSTDGDVQLTPTDGSEPFAISSDRLSELSDDNLAYDKAKIDTNDQIWGAIEDVEARFREANDDRDAFVQATRCLFKGAA